jgi:hypothetical protein
VKNDWLGERVTVVIGSGSSFAVEEGVDSPGFKHDA